MAHDDEGKLFFYSVLGFGAGIWIFFKGFREFRKYRVLADTPEIPIRSIPMGLVEIHGTAVDAGQLLTSPVARVPCCLYKVVIEKWKTDSRGRGGSWSHHRTDIEGAKFYVQDATAKILVDPTNAELDLPQNDRCEASHGTTGLGTGGARQKELLRYVTQADMHRVTSTVARGLAFLGPSSDPRREATRHTLLEAFQHTPGSPDLQHQMIALMGPKIRQHIQEMPPQSDPQREQARLAALEALQHPPGSPEFVAGMQRAASFAPPEERQQFLAVTGTLNPTESAPLINLSAASGRYRFTEYCIIPGQSYDITGTAVENPNPQDEHDRNLITKGQNEPTFLISSKSEKETEATVRNRALKMIFGGAALALICLAIILGKLGLF